MKTKYIGSVTDVSAYRREADQVDFPLGSAVVINFTQVFAPQYVIDFAFHKYGKSYRFSDKEWDYQKVRVYGDEIELGIKHRQWFSRFKKRIAHNGAVHF